MGDQSEVWVRQAIEQNGLWMSLWALSLAARQMEFKKRSQIRNRQYPIEKEIKNQSLANPPRGASWFQRFTIMSAPIQIILVSIEDPP